MLVYVDESGDAGLKLARGSSAYFVIALAVFDEGDDAAAANQRIGLLRRELNLHSGYEFKFNKCRPDHRTAFLQAMAPYDFFYYGIVINKLGLYGPGFKVKESFYKYATQLVFLNAREHLENADVYIDANGDRQFRRKINVYLKKRVNQNKRHIRRIGFLDSKTSGLIQMEDMIAGAINRSYSGKADAKKYIEIIRPRQARLQVWPSKSDEPKS